MPWRIDPDGTVRGLWSEAVVWSALGPVSVRRVSHVEFCPRRQQWYVQAARPRRLWRRLLQAMLQRPYGEILHWAVTRQAALQWEQEYYSPGGEGWEQLTR